MVCGLSGNGSGEMRQAVLTGSGTSGLATLRNRFGERFLATKRARSAGDRGVWTFALHGIDVGALRAQLRRATWTGRRKFRLLVEAEEVADHRDLSTSMMFDVRRIVRRLRPLLPVMDRS